LAGLLLFAAPLLVIASNRLRAVGAVSQTGITKQAGRTRWRYAGFGCALALILLLGDASAKRAALFESEFELWRDAAAKSQSNTRPHIKYAMLLRQLGRHREARVEALAAQAIDPFSSEVALFVRVYELNEVTQ
jgi:hypothetical protein